MTREEQEQYLALKKKAQQEERAEQAKIRRAAKKWIENRWGMSVDQIDKLTAQYRERQKNRQLASHQQMAQPQRHLAEGAQGAIQRQAQPAAPQVTPKGAGGAGTSAGCIGRNTSPQITRQRENNE